MTAQNPARSCTVQGRTLTFPIAIASASCFGGVFLCAARAASAILAPAGLRPLAVAGRTPVVVLAVNYHNVPGNVLGDYNELGVAFMVRTPDGSVLPHVHQLPVSQGFTREAGQRLWGFPKWLAEISLVTGRHGGQAALSLAGHQVVRMRTAIRRGLRLPDFHKAGELTVCQIRDGVLGQVHASAIASGLRFTAGGGTKVIPGSGHPLAEELTALGFPNVPALASFSVERMTADLAEFEPSQATGERQDQATRTTAGSPQPSSSTDTSARPVALVTGAASGIGLAATRRLVERGYVVAAVDVNQEALAALEQELAGRVRPSVCDVRDMETLQATVDIIEHDLGPIQHVLCSAGIARVGPILQADRGDEELMMDVNFGGVVNLVHACLPRLLDRGLGEFAVIASLTGLIPPKKMAGYGASKAAVIAYLESLRHEHAGKGVKIACVCPAAVSTPMTVDFFADPANRARSMPMPPEKVVRAIEDGLAANAFMIYPGIARILALTNRFAPGVMRLVQKGRLGNLV